MKLRDARNEITVYERNPAGITHGWGVVFWDDLLTNLRANDLESACEILDHSFRWTGQVVDVKGREPFSGEGDGFGICRRQFLAILTRRAVELGVKIHFGHDITDTTQLPEADLIVASDGVGSRIRDRHADQFKTKVVVGRNKYVWLYQVSLIRTHVPSRAGRWT
jgi:anthraniloyl-CoA monooxygenase